MGNDDEVEGERGREREKKKKKMRRREAPNGLCIGSMIFLGDRRFTLLPLALFSTPFIRIVFQEV